MFVSESWAICKTCLVCLWSYGRKLAPYSRISSRIGVEEGKLEYWEASIVYSHCLFSLFTLIVYSHCFPVEPFCPALGLIKGFCFYSERVCRPDVTRAPFCTRRADHHPSFWTLCPEETEVQNQPSRTGQNQPDRTGPAGAERDRNGTGTGPRWRCLLFRRMWSSRRDFSPRCVSSIPGGRELLTGWGHTQLYPVLLHLIIYSYKCVYTWKYGFIWEDRERNPSVTSGFALGL